MPYKIIDDRLILADASLWIISYNEETGLVMSFTENEAQAKPFVTEEAANSACYLINNNSNNSFIGHVPPPHH